MMGDRREDYTNLSLMLSRVMDDVGINEESVLRRRRANLVRENIHTFLARMHQTNDTYYIFGSQTEGTTTEGLNSDTDILFLMDDVNAIEDWKDWEPDKDNLLVIQDKTTFPGYCTLQMLRRDAPLPDRRVILPWDECFVNNVNGNVLMKRFGVQIGSNGDGRNGPAATHKFGEEYDFVPAFICHNWPKYYKQWITDGRRRRDWPTPEMIQHMKSTGCFVVKASHKLDDRNETWRISTSLAERCLMFSLNISQIRCYVLLKMIIRTFIEPDTISSYMCKTLLFHVIENTRKEFWREHNLLQCVHQVLLYMLAAILDGTCPNYFNKSANLFLGKIDINNKARLLQRLRSVIRTNGQFVLEINFDEVNRKLERYTCMIGTFVSVQDVNEEKMQIHHRKLIDSIFLSLGNTVLIILSNQPSKKYVLTTCRDLIKMGHIENKAVCLILPFMCSYFASIEASKSVFQGTEPTPICLRLFHLSLHSDVSSSRLKFASYLYCTGQFERTLSVLYDVERRLNDGVMMKCGCHWLETPKFSPRFGEREASRQYPTTGSLALCVMFSMAERNCCPQELQYEMLRSTNKERTERDEHDNSWMDLAVMDSHPYIYYLQYMTFRHLGQHDQQYTTLNKLSDCVRNNEYLTHRETAYNVLGQCMEYEGWLYGAIECYKRSLIYRPTNNAVRWHIKRLIV